MPVISSNEYLDMAQMKINAQSIMTKMLAQGWSKNAICGILGNMETESTMNSGLWESLSYGNMSGGFGLVQWTPASIITSWMDAHGFANNWASVDGQLAKLNAEVLDGSQWYTTSL